MNEKTAYPLCWPPGWPKTEPSRRERAKFKQTLQSAISNLQREIQLMGGTEVLLSSNYTLGQSSQKEPGVVAYFTWCKNPMAIPCDRWDRIESNIQAIALTVEAMRGMERWGAKHMIQAMFTGFKQLPASTSGNWWDILGVGPGWHESDIRTAYLALVKKHHPDTGGNAEQFLLIQAAFEQYEACLK